VDTSNASRESKDVAVKPLDARDRCLAIFAASAREKEKLPSPTTNTVSFISTSCAAVAAMSAADGGAGDLGLSSS